jgi:glucose-6-phosphate-specific signal transduction histidine kinase
MMRNTRSLRQEVAEELHERLGQHLLGSLLAAHTLVVRLERRDAPEADQARRLLEHLREAAGDVKVMVRKLDLGRLR